MKIRIGKMLSVALLFLLCSWRVSAQEERSGPAPAKKPQSSAPADWRYTTPQYQTEALQALIHEGNVVAKELNLPESLPITRSNIVGFHIAPPALGFLGSITTSNYVYYMTISRKFSFLEQCNSVERFHAAKAAYRWPVSRLDTNAAFQSACEILSRARMDVAALNRDCTVEINPVFPYGSSKRYFLPVYWVIWRKSQKVVAFVEFLEPTKTIRQLHVEESQYILRKELNVPSLRDVLTKAKVSEAYMLKHGIITTNAPAVSD